ncbi:unnamed protein product [Enterobius vermicularis]|uniref:MAM domain-containing protein n=1 Tax=Enterobius vermicularis TaxID=51028 RepID=A0A158Q973_ENTVE|nr:unnamed protein product [Enterobius vermicularis]
MQTMKKPKKRGLGDSFKEKQILPGTLLKNDPVCQTRKKTAASFSTDVPNFQDGTIVFFRIASSQILSSSDLNCNFNNVCQWRNATNGEQDDGDFVVSNHLVFDLQRITAKDNDIGDLKFCSIKSTINYEHCQLGGAVLKLWYYRTGVRTTLEACIRQPPGSLLVTAQKCFPLFVGNHIRQWLYGAVEFPPISQPFELIIKATFIQPNDIVVIDDIIYDAILCGMFFA